MTTVIQMGDSLHESINSVDKVVQSVTNATKRLSQISTNTSTSSKKRKAQNRIGPWKLGRTLGRGSTGRVRLAKNVNTGQLAAVKIVPKSTFRKLENPKYRRPKTADGKDLPYGIEREIIIMKLISHPNIMGLYDVWENKNDLYLILEYVEGGELFDYLIKQGKLPEFEAVNYFKQIIHGIAYLHQFNICHRDLKPENLLLDVNKNIKVADFGMAALEVNEKLLETSCGSPHYASPEIVAGKNYHGAPSDIWSCGIILFALLTGHLPFDDENIRKLLLKVQNGKYVMPSDLSWEAKDLISRILRVNPNDRITIDKILSHPLLTRYPEPSTATSNSTSKNLEFDKMNMKPISSVEKIDKEILKNLCVLFHNCSEQTIINRLLSNKFYSEKTFYYLLLKYRNEHAARESKNSNYDVNNNNNTNNNNSHPLSESKKHTIPKSTSIIKTKIVDANGETRTVIRTIPNSLSNYSGKSISHRSGRKPALNNITNTSRITASTSSTKKKDALKLSSRSRNNSSKSLTSSKSKRRHLHGQLNHDLPKLPSSKEIKQQLGHRNLKSPSNQFESRKSQNYNDNKENMTPSSQAQLSSLKSKNKSPSNSKSFGDPNKTHNSLKETTLEISQDQDSKLKEQQMEQSRILQQKQKEALWRLSQQTLDSYNDSEQSSSTRVVTSPATLGSSKSSLDPRMAEKNALLRSKTLGTKSTLLNQNTALVLQSLGIDVNATTPKQKLTKNFKTSSSKNLSLYLNKELNDDNVNDEVLTIEKFNAREKKSIYKSPSISSSIKPKKTTYKSMLGGINEDKPESNIDHDHELDDTNMHDQNSNNLVNDATLMSINQKDKSGLIPNPRFSRFSFNAFLNQSFDPSKSSNRLSTTGLGINIKEKMSHEKLVEEEEEEEEEGEVEEEGKQKEGKEDGNNNNKKTSVSNDTYSTSSQNENPSISEGIDISSVDFSGQQFTSYESNNSLWSVEKEVSRDYTTMESEVSHFDIMKADIITLHKIKPKTNVVETSSGESSRDTLLVHTPVNKQSSQNFDDDSNQEITKLPEYEPSINSVYENYRDFVDDEHKESTRQQALQSLTKGEVSEPQSDYERFKQSAVKTRLSEHYDDETSVEGSAKKLSFTHNETISNIKTEEYDYEEEEEEEEEEVEEVEEVEEIAEVEEEEEEDKKEEKLHNLTKTHFGNEGNSGSSLNSTQIFSTMTLNKKAMIGKTTEQEEMNRDTDKEAVSSPTVKHQEQQQQQHHQHHHQQETEGNSNKNNLFRRLSLKPKRVAPKAPEEDNYHNSYKANAFKGNDNSGDNKIGGWFRRLIGGISQIKESNNAKHQRQKSHDIHVVERPRDKNVVVIDSHLSAIEITRVVKNTLQLKIMEGSVVKVIFDDEFGLITGVIPAKYAGGRRLKFKMEIIDLINSSSLHIFKEKGSDKGFQTFVKVVDFTIKYEESAKMKRGVDYSIHGYKI